MAHSPRRWIKRFNFKALLDTSTETLWSSTLTTYFYCTEDRMARYDLQLDMVKAATDKKAAMR